MDGEVNCVPRPYSPPVPRPIAAPVAPAPHSVAEATRADEGDEGEDRLSVEVLSSPGESNDDSSSDSSMPSPREATLEAMGLTPCKSCVFAIAACQHPKRIDPGGPGRA